MNYVDWHKLMNKNGWYPHIVTKRLAETSSEWWHESAKKADGSPITIDGETAELHRQAGTVPPPF